MGKGEENDKIELALRSLQDIQPAADFAQSSKERILFLTDLATPRPQPTFGRLRSHKVFLTGAFLLFFLLPETILLARKSLPGELLYPVKVGLEEAVELALPEEEKKIFEFWQMEERAQEILLAAEKNHPGLAQAALNYENMVEKTEKMADGDARREQAFLMMLKQHEGLFIKHASDSAISQGKKLASLSEFCKKKALSFESKSSTVPAVSTQQLTPKTTEEKVPDLDFFIE